MGTYKTRIDIPSNSRTELAALLNARLADALMLSTQTKQAHWNVKGPNFIALHEMFDTFHTEAEEYVDLIAERITALGGTAYGTAQVAAEKSALPEYPLEIVEGPDHLNALADSFAAFGKLIREASSRSGELGDDDTADLFTEVSRGVDKSLWFIEAHLQAAK